MILLAGWAAAQLIRSIPKTIGKIIVCVLLAAGGIHLGWQGWRCSFKLYDDSLNPYVYAHTVSDIYVLVDRVKELSKSYEAGRDMPIPYNRTLELNTVPQVPDIVGKARDIVQGKV